MHNIFTLNINKYESMNVFENVDFIEIFNQSIL